MSVIRRILGITSAKPVITELRAEAGDADSALGLCHCSNGPLKM